MDYTGTTIFACLYGLLGVALACDLMRRTEDADMQLKIDIVDIEVFDLYFKIDEYLLCHSILIFVRSFVTSQPVLNLNSHVLLMFLMRPVE